MCRKFIAIIVAAAVAVTAVGAAPARAGNDDLARALAAIAGIAIIGAAINDRKHRKEERNREEAGRGHRDDRGHDHFDRDRHRSGHGHAGGDHVGRGHWPEAQYPSHPIQPRPLPRRANRKLLPGDCLNSYDSRNGRIRMFGQRCLQRNYDFADELPRACAVRVRQRGGVQRGYDARCLRDRGYSLARR